MAFYWVNIGKSNKIVKESKYLWAPDYTFTKSKKKIEKAGWKFVPKVLKGDVIFCYFKKRIQFIAIAKNKAYSFCRPITEEFSKWNNEGHKIDVDLHILNNPINKDDIKDEIFTFYNKYCKPKLITSSKNISQNYLISLPDGLANLLLKLCAEDSILIQKDMTKNNSKKSKINKTTSESIIKARIGQGKFRNDVLGLWNNTCPISKVDKSELLIASHIVSWQLSNDEEKLDPYNGLPLSPSLDKLFDKGYISFSDDGNLLFNKIYEENLKQLGIDKKSRINNLNNKHKAYLKRHRDLYYF